MKNSRNLSLDFPIRGLWPEEEKDHITGAELIRLWGLSIKDFVHLLKDEDFRWLVKPFYTDEESAQINDIESLSLSRVEIEQFKRLFRSEDREPAQSKQEKKGLSTIQRHYWRTRAVAEFLWKENEDWTVELMAGNEGITSHGCEYIPYEKAIIRSWIRDLCPNKEDPDYVKVQLEIPERPTIKAPLRRRDRCRAIAALLWARPENAGLTTTAMAKKTEMTTIGCEGHQYTDARTVEDYIRDLSPSTRRNTA